MPNWLNLFKLARILKKFRIMLTANDERQFILCDQIFLLLVKEEKLLCDQLSPGQTPLRSALCVLFVSERCPSSGA